MDSNSNNSSDISWPKLEIDTDLESPKREPRLHWSTDNTKKLIDHLEKDCKELWDVKHPMYKHRPARQGKLEYLADIFGTETLEISRKIHNLRTQFNNELRKMKRRQVPVGSCEGSGGGGLSTWDHFEALSFLLRAPSTSGDPLDVDGVNLALAEFQADEEEEFGAAARAHSSASSSGLLTHSRSGLRVAASAPPPLPPSAHPMMWPEEPVPRIRPGLNADECQIFGDFVASELRMLRSSESRKRLKRMIQKAILQIGEEEDTNGMNG